MRRALNWHKKQADSIVREMLPDDLDDAIIVVDLVAGLLELASNSLEKGDLSSISAALLL